jgi:hypothetical protein
MSARRGNLGYLLASGGAVALALSLWSPWYDFHLPPQVLARVDQVSQQFGILGPLIRSGAAQVGALGPVGFSAWKILSTLPAVLLVMAVVGGGLSLLAFSGRAAGIARLVTVAGAVALALSLYRLVSFPGLRELLEVAWGLPLAALASGAMVAGGLFSASVERSEVELPLRFALPQSTESPTAVWSTAGSVPPPR